MWVATELETLRLQLDNPPNYDWTEYPHTQKQVGYLAGLMDLGTDEKDIDGRADRYELLSLILGWAIEYDLRDFPGMVLEKSEPGPSSKDIRITRWMHSVLITYFKDGNGAELVNRLGYITATTKRAAQQAAASLGNATAQSN